MTGVCLVAALVVWLSIHLNGTPVLADDAALRRAGARSEPISLGGGLDGFESPYLGHTGSWDGKGGGMFGSSKAGAMDKEVGMGLRWTFMCVYWRALEPEGPVTDLEDPPKAWRRIDEFVIAAHERKLNILMQAPVVGGNAGGPPAWAGRREKGKSAPRDMPALAAFAGRLAQRYAPGGTLAAAQGWGDSYGVRAWELDNEPESYRTNWGGQAGDYAEFVTLASAAIRKQDAQAVILAPACAGGGHAGEWVRQALDGAGRHGSPTFRDAGQAFSMGPAIDVASFHVYEGLDSFLTGSPRTVGRAHSELKRVFDQWAAGDDAKGAAPPQAYWHTEGNYDFLGLTSGKRRAAWRWQFFTRAFASGVDKVCVMDASPEEQVAVRLYVKYLPDPFPMRDAKEKVRLLTGEASVYVHDDAAGEPGAGGRVWIAWAKPGAGGAEIEIPVANDAALVVDTTGHEETGRPTGGTVRLQLRLDKSIPPPLIVVDRP